MISLDELDQIRERNARHQWEARWTPEVQQMAQDRRDLLEFVVQLQEAAAFLLVRLARYEPPEARQ